MKIIEIKNISKKYKIGGSMQQTMLREALVNLFKFSFRGKRKKSESIWALDDVSFSVDEGEVVGIIGRNGAGKSTILKVLSKITYATRGDISVQGRIASLLEVGTGFHEELTGRENIFLNGSILGMNKKEIKAKLDAIVEFSGVEKFIDTPIKRYSSGMKLRLGFAVAAHLDPDILIVDEVLAVGDAEFQKKCLKAMDDLRGGGRTVVFVSHNMMAVESLCSRVIWLDNGRVKMDGAPHKVIKAYLSAYTEVQNSKSDLLSIRERRGTGDIRFSAIEFLDDSGKAKEVVRSGDKITVRLHYVVTAKVENPHFGFEIYTELGALVTETSTWSAGCGMALLQRGDGFVDLQISFLNLMPNRYYITLWAATVGKEDYDMLENCAFLDVESSNYYGTGLGIDSRYGVLFLDCSWEHGRQVEQQQSMVLS